MQLKRRDLGDDVASVSAGTAVTLPGEVTHDVSVVIVSYNTREITLRCVESVLANSDGLSVEVIVVDNCSKDGSAAALRERFPQITVVESPVNGGFAAGNNQGFERAHGRYLLLLNPDTELRGDALRRAQDHMDAHPRTGVLGARAWDDAGAVDPTIFRFLNLRQILLSGIVPAALMRRTSLFGDARYAGLALDREHEVDAVAGCFMFVRREVVERVGGLDERFFMYGEESEWCHRIARAGWTVRYHPGVEIMHHGGASTADMSVWRTVEVAKGHLLFLRITRGELAARAAAAMIAARDAARLASLAPSRLLRGWKDHPGAAALGARMRFAAGALLRPPAGQSLGRGPHSS